MAHTFRRLLFYPKVAAADALRNPHRVGARRRRVLGGMLQAMRIEFSKMQGLGNDFVVFNAPPAATGGLNSDKLRALADRHTGIGFDQALMLEEPRDGRSRVFYRIFNSDGSEVEQCGNGARCIAALLYARQPGLGRELTMESCGGSVRAFVREDGLVSVSMGVPDFRPGSLPMQAPEEAPSYRVRIADTDVEFGAVSMGNPHIVLRVADVDAAPVAEWGPQLERHPMFPRRANVGFMQIVDRGHIRLRVFERGVGETLACGTGICAAVAVGRRQDLLDADVAISLKGGDARVSWAAEDEPLWLTGPATSVFTGSIEI